VTGKNQDPQTPSSLPNVNPPEVAGAGQTRLIIEAVKETVADLKVDVRTIRDHRFSDMMWHIAALAGAVILLGSMLVAAYFKIDDRIQNLSNETKNRFEAASNSSTRIETKLDDLVQRIAPTPVGQGSQPRR
jgi:hypothetical protein